jgi:transcription initiation factor TFIIH subunit 3
LYPSLQEEGKLHFDDFKSVREHFVKELKDLMNETETLINSNPKVLRQMFSGAMSMALCYIHKLMQIERKILPRILIIQATPDAPEQYISFMNCVFSAQKKNIPVDSCLLNPADSSFLQQAAHLTGGIYLKPMKQEALVQYLLGTYLTDSFARKYIQLPVLRTVDYRAACFCHKKMINIGYICSVCLSIFCENNFVVCPTCQAKFPIARKKLPTKKK